MKILITGGAGFIGSHLVEACLNEGNTVAIIDNLSTGLRENIWKYVGKDNCRFFHVDIMDKDTVARIFADVRPEVVFHLAAQINVRDSIKNPLKTMTDNVSGTVNVLEAMIASGCKRFIFSSTGGVMFSTGEVPYSEKHTPSPVDPYAVSKRAGELLLDFYSTHHGIKATSLRYANVYGPRQNPHGEAGVVAIFLDRIKNNQIPTIYGDGEQTRDFIHVADVVSANLHVLEKNLKGIFHVGTGIETSVNEIWKIVSVGTDIIPLNAPALGELKRSLLDSTKLQDTGWTIKHKISDYNPKE